MLPFPPPRPKRLDRSLRRISRVGHREAFDFRLDRFVHFLPFRKLFSSYCLRRYPSSAYSSFYGDAHSCLTKDIRAGTGSH